MAYNWKSQNAINKQLIGSTSRRCRFESISTESIQLYQCVVRQNFLRIIFGVGDKFFFRNLFAAFEKPIIRHIFGLTLIYLTKLHVFMCRTLLFFLYEFGFISVLSAQKVNCLWKCVSSQSLRELRRELMLAIIHIHAIASILVRFFSLFWNVDIIEMSFARYHTYESDEKSTVLHGYSDFIYT